MLSRIRPAAIKKDLFLYHKINSMIAAKFSKEETNPLQSIEQWEDDVLSRYPVEGEPAKAKEELNEGAENGRFSTTA